MKISEAAAVRPTVVLMLASAWWLMALAAVWPQDKFQAEFSEDTVGRLERARELKKHDPEQAVRKLETLVAQVPDYYRAQHHLGISLAQQGKYDEALEVLGKALEIKQARGIGDASLYNSIGWVHFLNGNYPRAQELLEQAVESDEPASQTTRLRAYNNLGTVYLQMGRYEASREVLIRAAEDFDSELARKQLRVLKVAEEERRKVRQELGPAVKPPPDQLPQP